MFPSNKVNINQVYIHSNFIVAGKCFPKTDPDFFENNIKYGKFSVQNGKMTMYDVCDETCSNCDIKITGKFYQYFVSISFIIFCRNIGKMRFQR